MVDILHRVGIKAPVDQVYKALATRAGLAAWWTTHTQGQGEVGGSLTFRFTSAGQDIGGFEMQVLELKPDARVLWQVVDGPAEWIGTRISFELKQDGEYAIVMFKHEGWQSPGEMMHHCSTKWATFLMSLKALGETGQGSPSPNDVRVSNWH